MTTSDRETLWVTDAEIARRWGVCDKTARRAIKKFARQFPSRDPLMAGKRYWPAVVAFMDARAGVNIKPVSNDGKENWNGKASSHRRRSSAPLAPTR